MGGDGNVGVSHPPLWRATQIHTLNRKLRPRVRTGAERRCPRFVAVMVFRHFAPAGDLDSLADIPSLTSVLVSVTKMMGCDSG